MVIHFAVLALIFEPLYLVAGILLFRWTGLIKKGGYHGAKLNKI